MQIPGNNNFEIGWIDRFVGKFSNYKKITLWDNTLPINESLTDGVVYRKIGTDYYKTTEIGPINALSLGLVNDNVTRNELILQKALEKLPPNQEIFFPSGGTFLFGPLPAKYNIYQNPVAINANTGVYLTGEGREKTNLRFLPGCVGIQITGGLTPRPIRISELSLQGPGADSALEGKVTQNGATRTDGSENPDVGRTIGSASLDNANYQFNGINMWGQTHLHNVNVSSFSGHNLCVFGSAEITVPGIPFDVQGNATQVGPTSIRFQLLNVADGRNINNEEKCRIGGINTKVGGIYKDQGQVFFDVPDPTLFTTGVQTLTILPSGGALIADNSTINGLCNFDFAGGSGLFITSDDSNQLTMFGGSFRENGLWGVDDGSFLGTFFYGTHFSRNGRRINQFGIDNIFGNDKLTIGPFIQRYISARSAFYGCYSEEGNQGPAIVQGSCGVVDGIMAAGVIGGFRREGNRMSSLSTGPFSLGVDGFSINQSDKPNISILGTIVQGTRNSLPEILFLPQTIGDLSKVYVGQQVAFFKSVKIVTSIIAGQGFTLGPLQDFLPPRSPTTAIITAYLITVQPVKQPELIYHELATGNFGFGHGRAALGQGETELLSFTQNGIQLTNLKLGNHTESTSSSITSYLNSLLPNTTVVPGNIIGMTNSINTPTSYICYSGGTLGTLASSGITLNNNGPTFTASQPIPGLQSGQYIIVQGITYQVGNITGVTFYVTPTPYGVTNGTVSYATPLFQPTDFGIGTLANRPTSSSLTNYDTGWRYLATDSNTWTTWTGSTWV